MDRAHRIGQDKPVLVLRLAAANSVDGRMLKRANSKLMLERLVIRKGAFMASEAENKASSLSNEELMELLKDSIPLKDEPQSGVVSDKVREGFCHATQHLMYDQYWYIVLMHGSIHCHADNGWFAMGTTRTWESGLLHAANGKQYTSGICCFDFCQAIISGLLSQ